MVHAPTRLSGSPSKNLCRLLDVVPNVPHSPFIFRIFSNSAGTASAYDGWKSSIFLATYPLSNPMVLHKNTVLCTSATTLGPAAPSPHGHHVGTSPHALFPKSVSMIPLHERSLKTLRHKNSLEAWLHKSSQNVARQNLSQGVTTMLLASRASRRDLCRRAAGP